jgi:hypothetical protein
LKICNRVLEYVKMLRYFNELELKIIKIMCMFLTNLKNEVSGVGVSRCAQMGKLQFDPF